ncbi:MAG: rhomboid family intramembrane serine protease [Rhodobacteraceae bacterium]|nr:rhomboid family intramembrane serine protease [Paracoccaceae bacterium]
MSISQPPAPLLAPLPWAVWLLALPIIGGELAFWAGAQGLVAWPEASLWRVQAQERVAVSPALQGWMWETGQMQARNLARYLLYGFVQTGPAQAALVVVIIAALGKHCAARLGNARLLGMVLAAQAGGAVLFGWMAEGVALLIGGAALIFALAGCFAAIAWHEAESRRALWIALALPLMLILVRLGLSVVTGGMVWLADICACLIALALAHLARPGLLIRLRRR